MEFMQIIITSSVFSVIVAKTIDYFTNKKNTETKLEYIGKSKELKKIYLPALKVLINENLPSNEVADVSINGLTKIKEIIFENLEYADEETEELFWKISEYILNSAQYDYLDDVKLRDGFIKTIIGRYDKLMRYFRTYYHKERI